MGAYEFQRALHAHKLTLICIVNFYPMDWLSLFAVGVGAVLGACARWGLGGLLNPLFPTLPLGTLCVNIVGGFLIGFAAAYFERNAHIPVQMRLLVITGFLGALTTFSTFSIEVVSLIGKTQLGWAIAAIGAHLIGSLTMTVLGILTFNFLTS